MTTIDVTFEFMIRHSVAASSMQSRIVATGRTGGGSRSLSMSTCANEFCFNSVSADRSIHA